MANVKEEYLAILLEKQDIHSKLMQGAELILQNGIDGIKEVAETQPEILLAAIQGLAFVVDTTWKEHLALVEQYFNLTDAIESVR